MADWNLGTGGLRIECEGPIAWCFIDRPEARNAMTPAMYLGPKRAVLAVNRDPVARALIITGVDDVFAPDGDMGGKKVAGDEPVPEELTHELLAFLAIHDSTAPWARLTLRAA